MLKSKYLVLLSFVLISGCALFKEPIPPGVDVRVQKEEVPIAVSCKEPIPAVPKFNFDGLKTSDDIYTKDQALLADRWLHLGYEKELLAALTACEK